MFWILVRHEWALLKADAAVRLTLLVFLISLAAAMALGTARARRERTDTALLVSRASMQREMLAAEAAGGSPLEAGELPRWDGRQAEYVANERGTYAVLPPPPLLALTVGQSDLYPNHLRVTARLTDGQMSGDQTAHPLALLAGHFDVTFVVLCLMPLMIVASSFDLTATERRSGTLRMLLATQVRLATVVGAKVIARGVLMLVLPVVLVVASPLMARAGLPVAGERLLLWTLAATAYGWFWLGLATVVNARATSAPCGGLALAGTWLLLVVLIPSLVNLAVKSLYPVPSKVEFSMQARAATREAILQGSRQLGSFLEDHPSSGTGREGLQQYAMLQEIRDTEVARLMQPLLVQHEGQLARQRAAMARFQYLSPVIVMQLALTEIAGTGDARYARFQSVAAAYQQTWRGFFQPFIRMASALSSGDVRSAPTFVFAEEPLSAVVYRVMWPLAALMAVALGLAAVGLRLYADYDVSGSAS